MRHFRSTPPRPVLLAGALLLTGPARCAGAASPADTIPRHETFTIASRGLAEDRIINVYTPPDYGASPRAFPVLYMLDGALDEDFPHVVSTVDSLIRLGRIRPVLVVGIANTQRRRDLTGPTVIPSDSAIAPRVGGSDLFRTFVRSELLPEVRRRYRITDETAVVGESLAGLFVVETMLLEPALFRKYIALSPALWWNAGAILRVAERRVPQLDETERYLYLAAANEPGIEAETARLAAILRSGAPRSLTWEYFPRPDLEHSTIFRALAPSAFVKTFK